MVLRVVVISNDLDLHPTVKSKIERMFHGVDKLFSNEVEVRVAVNKSGRTITASAFVREMSSDSLIIKAESDADNAYDAALLCFRDVRRMIKSRKSIKEYKEKALTRQHEPGSESNSAAMYIIDSHHFDSQQDSEDAIEDAKHPAVIAETNITIETMSVEMAVISCEILSMPMKIFINSSTGKLNIIKRRDDGLMSWIDLGCTINK